MADGSTGSPRRNRRPTKQEQKQREQHALDIYNRTSGTRDDRWRETQRQLEREFAASGGNPRSKAFTLISAARLDGASTSRTNSGAESRESWRLVHRSAPAFFASQKKVAS